MKAPQGFTSLFPELDSNQLSRLEAYVDLLLEWNERVNLISRKNTEHVWEQHIAHSLMMIKVISFQKGQRIMDVGTGGGLPGIPLACVFPEAEFFLVDSIGKKIHAVNDMIERLELNNVFAAQHRAENVQGTFDFVVSRAVTRLPEFTQWVNKKIHSGNGSALANGILYIKGGDFQDELKKVGGLQRVWEMSEWSKSEFFETKKIVWLKGK